MAANTCTENGDAIPDYVCKDFADISNCFKQLHTSIFQDLSKLKTDVKDIDEHVTVVETSVSYLHEENRDMQEKHFPSMEEKLKREENERIALELWGRKWNLIIRGIPGNQQEQPRETDKAVRQFMSDTLNFKMEADTMLFQAVHRLPNGPEGKRNIIVRFLSLIDRDFILNKAIKTLRPGSSFAVVPDLPPPLAKLRHELLSEKKQLSEEERRKTKLVYLKHPPFLKLVSNSLKVVNLKFERLTALNDGVCVYIGRQNRSQNLPRSKWANPYTISTYGRDRALQLYEDHIWKDKYLYDALNELSDKILFCYCAPKKCHGDILRHLFFEKESF